MVSRSQLLRSWFFNDDVITAPKILLVLFSFNIALKIVNGRFVVSSPENKEKKSPDPWDAYKIPNIHTARMKFYNDITKEIYQSAFAELQLSRFQDYLTQQRTFRWEVQTSHLSFY